MHRLRVAVASVAVTASICAAAPAVAGTGPAAVGYRPPVDAPVIDRFRPPTTPYGPGNRGIDYATVPGTAVGAAAVGVVAFAGPVGAGLHVVVLHPDGIRTSYSFLASIVVRRGQPVAQGEPVGTAGTALHFGARAGDAYVDPLVLLAPEGRVTVRLVPDAERGLGSEADERSGLRRLLGGLTGAVVGVGATAVGWARDGAEAAGRGTVATLEDVGASVSAVVPSTEPPWLRLAQGVSDWWERRNTCTPAGVAAPRVAGRRRVVLVAGLGSTSESAGIDGVDTAALGYARADVVRFSYRGGSTADSSYGATDTQVDIRESGRRLRALLERLAADGPGVPIDVIAHSQGGLVARVALGSQAPVGVEHLITLATPHQGADLATALDLTGATPRGAVVERSIAELGVSGIDPTSTSVRQLSELSGFIGDLNRQPLPEGVRVTSIAGRADVVVPAPHAYLAGATNVVVAVHGLNEHPLVPAAPAATREMALALSGMPPSCEGLLSAVLDQVTGDAIAGTEDATGLLLWMAAR